MTDLDVVAHRAVADLRAELDAHPVPLPPTERARFRRVTPVARAAAIAVGLAALVALPALIFSVTESEVVTETTVAPVSEPTPQEGWPVVRASQFIVRPGGAVFGVPTAGTISLCHGCAAVTLADGRVLAVGSSGHAFNAEIWDPGTGQWSRTGSPVSQDAGWSSPARAILLSDGRVLVALDAISPGAGGPWAALEIYDPADGSFRRLAPTIPRLASGAQPVLMTDGRVFIGGAPSVVFDPANESFLRVGEAPSDAQGLALVDGRVLLIGRGEASIFDPVTSQFTAVDPAYPTERGAALALLQDGRVLVAGGLSPEESRVGDIDVGSVRAQVFDPTANRFSAVGSMLEPRKYFSAVTLPSGDVAIIGGVDGRIEVFDPETATFQSEPMLTRHRDEPAVALLHDGNLLVIGGSGKRPTEWQSVDPTTPRTAEIYHPHRRPVGAKEAGLTGFTMGSRFNVNGNRLQESEGGISLSWEVPAGGLEGATYAHVRWEAGGRFGSSSGGEVAWVGAEGIAVDWEPAIVRALAAVCDQGCEFRERIARNDELGGEVQFIEVVLHVQYRGEIPDSAHGISLTLVEGG